MKLSIVIVNYKTPQLLCDCLSSIAQHEPIADYEIIVVDNCSEDNSEQVVKSSFPNVRWLQMGYNSGFARANNYGIQHASGKYVLLLNSDVLLETSAISQALAYFETNTNIGLLSVQLRNADGSLQVSHYPEESVSKLFRQNSLVIKCRRMLKLPDRHQNHIEAIKELHAKTHDASWLCGAFLLSEKEILQESPLDEDFFMYSEDIALSDSILKKKRRIVYLADTHIIHLGGGSSDKKKTNPQIFASELLRIRKQKGVCYFLFYAFLLKFNYCLDAALSRINRLPLPEYSKHREKVLSREFGNVMFMRFRKVEPKYYRIKNVE